MKKILFGLLLCPWALPLFADLTPPLLPPQEEQKAPAPAEKPARTGKTSATQHPNKKKNIPAAKKTSQQKPKAQPSEKTSVRSESAAVEPAAPKTPPKPAGPAVMVVYPPEGQSEEDLRSLFILGAVARPGFPFRINGTTVPVHPKGGFLAYLPVQAGPFTFRCEQDLPEGTTFWTRSIRVSSQSATPPQDPPAILAESVSPKEDLELRPNDWLNVSMRGSPGLSGSFSLRGLRGDFPMAETRPGVYEGAYQVQPSDDIRDGELTVSLKAARRAAVRTKAPGKASLTHRTPETVAVRSEGIVNVRSGPGRGYILFPPVGTRFLSTGRAGRELRVRLSEQLSAWIDERSVEKLPAGTPPPQSILRDITVSPGGDADTVTLNLSQKIPFQIEENSDLSGLRVRLYSTVGHTNWINYGQAGELPRRVSWSQVESDVVDIVIRLEGGRLWGYDASWRGEDLRLELRRPPRLAHRPASVFKDRLIAVDAGHGVSAPGAVGPRGTWEQDANMRLALDLQSLLQAEGAQVLLTRGKDEDDVPLMERTRRAAARRADLFLSVHNNALSDGENPFERPHGSSVFFYHPHSQALARSVYSAYERLAPIPGEGLRYGNLFVARMTQMPALLTESAYMMFPAQEELLLDPAQRRKFALAMLEGLRGFLESERSRQAASLPASAQPQKTAAPTKASVTTKNKPASARRTGR
ncbi:MAG: N-acetylmuramoyl-L-alanine amidase [Elusimicrobiota bacterium]|jgi:N-acetylmuramoyl-L-alanine amidase